MRLKKGIQGKEKFQAQSEMRSRTILRIEQIISTAEKQNPSKT